jgi:hypothetical protein
MWLECQSTTITMLPPLPSTLRYLCCDDCPLLIQQREYETIHEYNVRWESLREKLRIQARCLAVKEELMAAAWHPQRVERWIEAYGIEILDTM